MSTNGGPEQFHETEDAGALSRRYEKPRITWEESLDVKSISVGCAKAVGTGCETVGTVSS